MSHIPLKFLVTRGDGYSTYFTFAVAGVPVDVSGWLVMFTAKTGENQSDDEAAIKYDSVNNPSAIYFTDSGSGTVDRVHLDIQPTDTDGLLLKPYLVDIQRVVGAWPWTFGKGTMPVSWDASRRITA